MEAGRLQIVLYVSQRSVASEAMTASLTGVMVRALQWTISQQPGPMSDQRFPADQPHVTLCTHNVKESHMNIFNKNCDDISIFS